jgi:AraC-like DNA-binding protein
MVLLDHGGAARDDVTLLRPPADLRGLIEYVWIQRHRADSAAWTVVPDGSPHLMTRLMDDGETGWPRVRLVGARTRAVTISHAGRRATIGVRLRPGSLPLLTGIAATELTDRWVFWSDVRPDANLEDAPGRSPEAIAAALVRAVRRAGGASAHAGIFAAGLAASTVSALSTSAAMSPRSLHARALREIGMSPKRYLRIVRLHRALRLARRQPWTPWADVAIAAGFADQSHFTRECRELLGATPTEWRALGAADSFKTPASPSASQ